MLILTRKIGEKIKIGDVIDIKVLKINPSQVTLGIDAPKEITVHREEIYNKIKKEENLKEQKQ